MIIPHNKILVNREIQKKIRSLFFRQVEMANIVSLVGIKESVIRRIVRERNWYAARERYLRYLCSLANIKNIPLCKMADLTDTKWYILTRVHRKYKTEKPQKIAWNKRINDKTEREIIDEYNRGKTAQSIAEQFGFKTNKTVLDVLIKSNVKRRPPKIQTHYDESFFEKINSHNKAYALGLIMTDGYIIKDYDGFGIQLTKEDGYILEEIRDLVGGTNPITYIDYSAKRHVLPNSKDMCRLHVFSKKIAEDLKKLGVVKRKTKVLRYNGCVPKKYMSSFFRGIVDGDGSIGKGSRNYYWMTISSASKSFLEDVRFDGFKWKINSFKCKNGNYIYNLNVSGGQKEIFRFYKWIYKNKGNLYLRRKYGKVQNCIN